MERLQIIAPELFDKLSKDTTKRHQAVCVAIGLVYDEVEPIDPIVAEAYSALRSNSPLDETKLTSLRENAESNDNDYFRLQAEGHADEIWFAAFRRARLADALLFALKDSLGGSAEEAIYEAAACFDDPKPLIDAVSSAISKP